MKQIKGRLELAKFRIRQKPITLPLLFASIVLLVFAIVELVHGNPSVCILFALLSFVCSIGCSNILKDITKKHQVELNGIKLKYGIKVL